MIQCIQSDKLLFKCDVTLCNAHVYDYCDCVVILELVNITYPFSVIQQNP